MHQGNKSFGLSSRVVGIGLALAGVLALGAEASAHEQTPPAAPGARVESTSSMTVVRDAETGRLRAATAAEQQELAQSQGRARSLLRMAAPQPLQKFHSGGARGVRLTDEFMSAAVVVRQPDGSLAHQCFDSHDHADTVARSPNSVAAVHAVKE